MQLLSTRRRLLQTVSLVGLISATGCLSTDQSDSTDTDPMSDNLLTWLSDANNFDGEAVEKTNADTVTIQVGAKAGDRHLAFDPPVVMISTGTTVQWQWTGNGGAHDVVFIDADVRSSQIHADSGSHFQHTFERQGSYRFVYKPHEDFGQKGAVIVE